MALYDDDQPQRKQLPTGDPYAFREWAQYNREHLKKEVFALPPDQQIKHERGCYICKEGLNIAFQTLSASQVVEADGEHANRNKVCSFVRSTAKFTTCQKLKESVGRESGE